MFTLRQDGSSFAGDVIKRTELVEAGVKMEKYELSSIEEKKSDQNVKEVVCL